MCYLQNVELMSFFTRYEEAADLFQRALDLAEVTQSSQHSWTTTLVNLGTCHRKLKCVKTICPCSTY